MRKGSSGQVHTIPYLVVLSDDIVGFAAEAGTKNAIGISINLEGFELQGVAGGDFIPFGTLMPTNRQKCSHPLSE